jgi:hypothetical protein
MHVSLIYVEVTINVCNKWSNGWLAAAAVVVAAVVS